MTQHVRVITDVRKLEARSKDLIASRSKRPPNRLKGLEAAREPRQCEGQLGRECMKGAVQTLRHLNQNRRCCGEQRSTEMRRPVALSEFDIWIIQV